MHYKCKLIGWWAFFKSSSDIFRTGKFFDKASQIAEETLIMTIDEVQEARFEDTKVQCRFYSDVIYLLMHGPQHYLRLVL